MTLVSPSLFFPSFPQSPRNTMRNKYGQFLVCGSVSIHFPIHAWSWHILKGKEKRKADFSPYPSNRDNRILNTQSKKSRIWLLRAPCERVQFLPRKQLGTCFLVGGQPRESNRVHLEQVDGVAFIVNTGQTLFSWISQHWVDS